MNSAINHGAPQYEDTKTLEAPGREVPFSLRCRVCLLSSPGLRLFNIYEYNLAEAFSRIIGTPQFQMSDDGLPQQLCWYCCAQLRRCDAFRARCQRSQQRLKSQLQGELTDDYIRTLDSQLVPNLTVSAVHVIDNTDTDGQIKQEPQIDGEIDICDIESIINKANLKTENEDENKQEITVKEKDVRKKRTVAKKKIDIEDDDYDVEPIEKIEIEFEEDNDVSDDDYVISAKTPVKKRGQNKERSAKSNGVKKMKKELKTDGAKVDSDANPKPVRRKRKKKEEVTRKFRTPANDYMPVFDFTQFENACSVTVVTLSKEDQLAEIAARKDTVNYQEATFKCEPCGKGFLAEPAFNNHRLRHSPSSGPYACEICSVRFKLRSRCQSHQDLHRLKFFCKECSFVSRARHQAKRHQAMHAGKTFECQHCGKSFNKSSTYLSHVRLSHPAMNVACDQCGETFVGQVGLRQHRARMHAEHLKSQFKCTTCSKNFTSLDALNRHTDTAGEHEGLSPCEQCGENCASEEALQAHVGERHPTESHRCEECCQTFTSAASYDLHHRRKHLNQPYSTAGKPQPRSYRTKRGEFVCEQCGKIMPTPTLLRLHQRIHRDVKPYACPQCPKTFAQKHAREWHVRSHTGEKPFQCPDCPLAFSINSNFKRHHKAVHLGQRARVPCAICARVFTTNSCLRVHVDMVHRGVPWPKRDRRRKRAPAKQ